MSPQAKTHIIIAYGPHDAAASEAADALTAFCAPNDSIKRVDENVHAPKGRPGAIWLGAFFNFDQRTFIKLVQSIAWEFADGVKAFARSAGGDRFEPFDLQMEFDIGRDRKLAAKFGWNLALPDEQSKFFTETYLQLLERRSELIRDSLANPNRFFKSWQQLASVEMDSAWLFECVQIYPESRVNSSRRHEFGPGPKDWEMIETKHRTISAKLAARGIAVQLNCDVVDVGPEIYEQVFSTAKTLQAGERLWVEGVIEIMNDGECRIEKVRRVRRDNSLPERTEHSGAEQGQ